MSAGFWHRRTCHLLLAVLACVLSACGESPPMRYYLLKSTAPDPGATSAPNAAPVESDQVPVRLEPVTIPPELDRIELVSRTGPYGVHVFDSERWAAPLEDQIRRALSEDLSERLPGLVADPNEPATNELRRL